jgi:predicted phage terminase large subunit-like protein
MAENFRILFALLRNNFLAFLQKSFVTLCPGQEFVPEWYLEAIAHALDRVRQGKCKRLIINLPPRSLKSITASVAFPAFLHGNDPTLRIIGVSYSGELAKKHSNDYRTLVESDWYKRLFPSTRIGQNKNTETEIELSERGYRLATSVGGTLTGRGGDIIIVDDPLKPDDAMSESLRNTANEWFRRVLLSRLDDKRSGAIVVVMQRVHMDDLCGFLTELSDEWEVLNLPAIAYADETIRLLNGRAHKRKTGEALSQREPLAVLENLKAQMGSDAFSAQYQQQPVPPGGAMIKRDWLNYYEDDDLPPSMGRAFILQSWDTANKGGPQNDWSVCTTWLLTRDIRWYLLDVWRARVDYPALKAAALTLAKRWKPRRVLVEDAASGTQLVQEMRSKIPGIIAIRPERDKTSRLAVASSIFEAGQVFFPQSATWLADLESELFSYPGGKSDDQVDSVSQALLDQRGSFMSQLTRDQLENILAQSRKKPRPPRLVF